MIIEEAGERWDTMFVYSLLESYSESRQQRVQIKDTVWGFREIAAGIGDWYKFIYALY